MPLPSFPRKWTDREPVAHYLIKTNHGFTLRMFFVYYSYVRRAPFGYHIDKGPLKCQNPKAPTVESS
jgi:hypothetical protein